MSHACAQGWARTVRTNDDLQIREPPWQRKSAISMNRSEQWTTVMMALSPIKGCLPEYDHRSVVPSCLCCCLRISIISFSSSASVHIVHSSFGRQGELWSLWGRSRRVEPHKNFLSTFYHSGQVICSGTCAAYNERTFQSWFEFSRLAWVRISESSSGLLPLKSSAWKLTHAESMKYISPGVVLPQHWRFVPWRRCSRSWTRPKNDQGNGAEIGAKLLEAFFRH